MDKLPSTHTPWDNFEISLFITVITVDYISHRLLYLPFLNFLSSPVLKLLPHQSILEFLPPGLHLSRPVYFKDPKGGQ